MYTTIRKSVFPLVLSLFVSSFIIAQECTLDIGGKNGTMVIDIFQLNEKQQTVMEELRGELEITTKSLEDEIQKLFASHPQGTEAELITLSDKYKILKEKLVSASRESDKKLLETFNQKQYERYKSLCYEAVREPIKITPISYKDSDTPE